jgi:probable rRNA maturation factor
VQVSTKMMNVILINELNIKKIPAQKKFQQWINAAIEIVQHKLLDQFTEMCISIVDKKTSAELNEAYRKKRGPTNVLSFNYDSMPGMEEESLGDLAICAEIVESEAIAQNKKSESHWAHLTIHGFLHLLGYDHLIDEEAHTMETMEMTILKKLHIDNPYK